MRAEGRVELSILNRRGNFSGRVVVPLEFEIDDPEDTEVLITSVIRELRKVLVNENRAMRGGPSDERRRVF